MGANYYIGISGASCHIGMVGNYDAWGDNSICFIGAFYDICLGANSEIYGVTKGNRPSLISDKRNKTVSFLVHLFDLS